MPQRTKEERKEYQKQYRLKNKEIMTEYQKQYRLKNKENLAQYKKEYNKTAEGKKSKRITKWKLRGILCYDYNLLYDIFLSTKNCEFCNCELDKCSRTRKCLDHDHTITDRFNVRGVLCHICNVKDVLKPHPLI
tara:strand:- start:156 stop:557 length:402 start_codon:yes stop_codon:yes gene_type:complete